MQGASPTPSTRRHCFGAADQQRARARGRSRPARATCGSGTEVRAGAAGRSARRQLHGHKGQLCVRIHQDLGRTYSTRPPRAAGLVAAHKQAAVLVQLSHGCISGLATPLKALILAPPQERLLVDDYISQSPGTHTKSLESVFGKFALFDTTLVHAQ
jgi:hypothetical protein